MCNFICATDKSGTNKESSEGLCMMHAVSSWQNTNTCICLIAFPALCTVKLLPCTVHFSKIIVLLTLENCQLCFVTQASDRVLISKHKTKLQLFPSINGRNVTLFIINPVTTYFLNGRSDVNKKAPQVWLHTVGFSL